MPTFRIYFEQVNQVYIDVTAETREIAEDSARSVWRKQNPPRIIEAAELFAG